MASCMDAVQIRKRRKKSLSQIEPKRGALAPKGAASGRSRLGEVQELISLPAARLLERTGSRTDWKGCLMPRAGGQLSLLSCFCAALDASQGLWREGKKREGKVDLLVHIRSPFAFLPSKPPATRQTVAAFVQPASRFLDRLPRQLRYHRPAWRLADCPRAVSPLALILAIVSSRPSRIVKMVD